MKIKALIMIILLLGVVATYSCSQDSSEFDLQMLLADVFDPQPGEKVLVMVDYPHGDIKDNPAWMERREIAVEWQAAFRELTPVRGFEVLPMLGYNATGGHSMQLPEKGEADGMQVSLEQVLADANVVVALTEYSATAPLVEFTKRYPNLRAASMPMVSRSMQKTALNADYKEVANNCEVLWEKLDRAEGAQLEFSTGHQLYIDLRERHAELDDGQLHANKQEPRVINLPSGEAYIAPYEGELSGQPSRTQGEIPILMNGAELALQIQENRIESILGEVRAADKLSEFLDIDPARTNIAELGLGCNDRAIVTGNVLEVEKVLGVHIAVGRSDHIGGSVSADDFEDPSHVVHQDVVYPQGGELQVLSLVLDYEDGGSEEIIRNGEYTVFDDELTITMEEAYFLWLFLVAVSLNYLAWDTVHGTPATLGFKLLWALVVLILGPIGLLAYLLSYRKLQLTRGSTNWRQALGASVCRAALFALWLGVVIFVFVIILPEPGPLHILFLTYLVPMFISLFVIGAPYAASLMDCGYWRGVRYVVLSEFIIQTMMFAAMFPTFFYLQEQWLSGKTEITNLLFWIILSLSTLLGAVILYPLFYWLASRGFLNWSLRRFEGTSVMEGRFSSDIKANIFS